MSGEHPSPPSRIQRWLFVLLAAALVFLTANALAWLASYRVAPAMHLFDPDPYRGARLKPGLDLSLPLGAGRRQLWAKTGARYRVVTDARGFRAGRPEVEAPGSPPAAFTVICVGDSSTFGQDVEDGQTYPRLLEKLLPPLLPGRTVRVINAGVPNAASRQGLVYLGRELLDDRPDLVVFAFGFNDNSPGAWRPWCPLTRLSDADLMQAAPDGAWQPIRISPLTRLQSSVLRLPLVAVARLGYWSLQAPVFFAAALQAPGNIPHTPSCQHCRVPPEDYRNNLSEVVELGRRHGFLPLLLVPYAVNANYSSAAAEISGQGRVPLVDVPELFSQFPPPALEARPDLKALLEPYRAWLGPEAFAANPFLYLTTDSVHPNAVGHALIAEALAQALAPYLKPPAPAGTPRSATFPEAGGQNE